MTSNFMFLSSATLHHVVIYEEWISHSGEELIIIFWLMCFTILNKHPPPSNMLGINKPLMGLIEDLQIYPSPLYLKCNRIPPYYLKGPFSLVLTGDAVKYL